MGFIVHIENEDCTSTINSNLGNINWWICFNFNFSTRQLLYIHSFIIHKIEEGRKLHGVGREKQMCILIDRGGTVRRNGEYKVEVLDMNIVPRVAELVRNLVCTFKVSWLSSCCVNMLTS